MPRIPSRKPSTPRSVLGLTDGTSSLMWVDAATTDVSLGSRDRDEVHRLPGCREGVHGCPGKREKRAKGGSAIGMEGGVQAAPTSGALHHLERA